MVSSLTGKQWQYFGSDKHFYSGISLNSGASWNFINFSGTNHGFGAHSQEEGTRFIIASSGTSVCEWSWNSGASIGGEIWGGDSLVQDGIFRSGLWVRSSVASQKIQVWYW